MIRPLLLLLFSLLVVTTGLSGQDELEARLDAVREFKTYMKKSREEALQVEAVITLEGNECRPAAEELFKLLKHKSERVRKTALGVLATYRESATFQAWIDAMPKMKDAEQLATIVLLLGQSAVEAGIPAIEVAASGPKATATVKYEAARALRRIGKPGTMGLLGTLLGDADASVRMAATDAVGDLELKAHTEPLIKLLGDSEWQVQSAAIGALGKLRPQIAVQPLIDLMKQPGRLQIECANALFVITTFDFGVDHERWQNHWNSLMRVEGWRIPTDEELAKARASRKKYNEIYGMKEGDRNSFGGIPTTSTNVLFIIDQSGSMDDMVVEVEKFEGYSDRRRLTIVKTDLMNTIDTLTKDTNFDIVAFATDLKVWKKRLVPANVVNRSAAKRFIQRLKPLGGSESQALAASGLGGAANLAAGKTNTMKALMYAFGIDPAKSSKAAVTGPGKVAMKWKIDTVYFLSDGRPSTGVLVDTNEILKEVTQLNEAYRMTFHTIAIGDFQKAFLRDLARLNGGEFVDMGR